MYDIIAITHITHYIIVLHSSIAYYTYYILRPGTVASGVQLSTEWGVRSLGGSEGVAGASGGVWGRLGRVVARVAGLRGAKDDMCTRLAVLAFRGVSRPSRGAGFIGPARRAAP